MADNPDANEYSHQNYFLGPNANPVFELRDPLDNSVLFAVYARGDFQCDALKGKQLIKINRIPSFGRSYAEEVRKTQEGEP